MNDRSEFGHWEGDSVEGKRSVGDGIYTEVGHKSRKLFARKVGRSASPETARAQLDIFGHVPAAKTTSMVSCNDSLVYRLTFLTRTPAGNVELSRIIMS